jgi:ABC-type polysaccharide/polyol phosphate transport system ATPase subunit
MKSAVHIEDLNKSFRLPHQKIATARGAFINMFRRRDYETFYALRNVSFDVEEGEFFSILGKNGSGKSTLLKILAGIYTPDSGKIEIHGQVSPFLELGIGFNPQLTGRENIYLNGTVLGIPKKKIDEKFDEIVAFSELERFIDQNVKNYSSGMQVRLAFAVAIHAERDILLMDEVLAVGDTNFRKKCMDVLHEVRQRGNTILFVTHDVGTVRKFSNRALVLHEGEIVTIGEAKAATTAYQNLLMSISQDEEFTKKAILKDADLNEDSHRNTISDIELYLENTNSRAFESGDSIVCEIECDIQQVVDDMHISVAIFDKKYNAWVSGNNTFFDGYAVDWKTGKNVIRLTLPNTTLHSGEFYLNINLFRGHPKDGNFLDRYDSRDDAFFFTVQPLVNSGGLVRVDHTWQSHSK